MSHYIHLENALRDVKIRCDVESLLNDMITVVQDCICENTIREMKLEAAAVSVINDRLVKKIKKCEADKIALSMSIDSLQQEAIVIRNKFVVDISELLYDSRHIYKLRTRISELEKQSHGVKELEKRLQDAEDTINEVTRQNEEAKALTLTTLSSLTAIAITTTGVDTVDVSNSIAIHSDSDGSNSGSNSSHKDSNLSADENLNQEIACAVAVTPVESHINFVSELEDTILLQVFAFLTTADVLNCAAVNKYAFKRVDALFGIESSIINDDWGIKSTPSATATNVDATPTKDRVSSTHSTSVNTTVAITPTTVGTVNSLLSVPLNNLSQVIGTFVSNATGNSLVPILSGMSLPPTVAAATTTVSATKPNAATTSSSSNIHATSANIFATSSATASSSTTAASSSAITSVVTVGSLSLEMADALSRKLTAAEMKAIIAMQERLKKQTVALEADVIEKEDLSARLASAESVRDFLIDKLKKAEVAIKSGMNETSKLKKQLLADSEVISFLDIRTQELDNLNHDSSKRLHRLQASYDLVMVTKQQREATLTAELTEYKGRCNDYETNYKSQKKLLVKEVKSLRAQLGSLTMERNQYKTQLQQVRETLQLADTNSVRMQSSALSLQQSDNQRNANSYGIRVAKPLF